MDRREPWKVSSRRSYTGWRHFVASLGYALAGLRRTFVREPNFRRELALGGLAVALTLWLGAPLAPILIACGMVLALELVNSAVEAAVDLFSPEHHELAEWAKDAAAAGVLVGAVTAVAVGLAVLGPPLWARIALLLGVG